MILSSQTDPPTLTNLDFSKGKPCFGKNKRLGAEDGLESVLVISWLPFGCYLGPLGPPFGSPYRYDEAGSM